MHMHVTTRNLNDPDEPPKHMIINDEIPFHRKWWINHNHWAMRTNHSVTTFATDEAITFEDRRDKSQHVTTLPGDDDEY